MPIVQGYDGADQRSTDNVTPSAARHIFNTMFSLRVAVAYITITIVGTSGRPCYVWSGCDHYATAGYGQTTDAQASC